MTTQGDPYLAPYLTSEFDESTPPTSTSSVDGAKVDHPSRRRVVAMPVSPSSPARVARAQRNRRLGGSTHQTGVTSLSGFHDVVEEHGAAAAAGRTVHVPPGGGRPLVHSAQSSTGDSTPSLVFLSPRATPEVHGSAGGKVPVLRDDAFALEPLAPMEKLFLAGFAGVQVIVAIIWFVVQLRASALNIPSFPSTERRETVDAMLNIAIYYNVVLFYALLCTKAVVVAFTASSLSRLVSASVVVVSWTAAACTKYIFYGFQVTDDSDFIRLRLCESADTSDHWCGLLTTTGSLTFVLFGMQVLACVAVFYRLSRNWEDLRDAWREMEWRLKIIICWCALALIGWLIIDITSLSMSGSSNVFHYPQTHTMAIQQSATTAHLAWALMTASACALMFYPRNFVPHISVLVFGSTALVVIVSSLYPAGHRVYASDGEACNDLPAYVKQYSSPQCTPQRAQFVGLVIAGVGTFLVLISEAAYLWPFLRAARGKVPSMPITMMRRGTRGSHYEYEYLSGTVPSISTDDVTTSDEVPVQYGTFGSDHFMQDSSSGVRAVATPQHANGADSDMVVVGTDVPMQATTLSGSVQRIAPMTRAVSWLLLSAFLATLIANVGLSSVIPVEQHAAFLQIERLDSMSRQFLMLCSVGAAYVYSRVFSFEVRVPTLVVALLAIPTFFASDFSSIYFLLDTDGDVYQAVCASDSLEHSAMCTWMLINAWSWLFLQLVTVAITLLLMHRARETVRHLPITTACVRRSNLLLAVFIIVGLCVWAIGSVMLVSSPSVRQIARQDLLNGLSTDTTLLFSVCAAACVHTALFPDKQSMFRSTVLLVSSALITAGALPYLVRRLTNTALGDACGNDTLARMEYDDSFGPCSAHATQVAGYALAVVGAGLAAPLNAMLLSRSEKRRRRRGRERDFARFASQRL